LKITILIIYIDINVEFNIKNIVISWWFHFFKKMVPEECDKCVLILKI